MLRILEVRVSRRTVAVLAAVLVTCAAGGASAAPRSPLGRSKQLIVVTTASWDSVSGRLQRYERANTRASWRLAGPAIPVVVGRNGLAWGRGLNAAANGSGPVKKEGDGKAPAGIFRLGPAFGYAPKAEARFVRMSYLPLTASTECVDDVRSRRYNALVDRSRVRRPDWNSSEHMRRPDELYRWGVVADHNYPHAVSGSGSCIFLHIWQSETTGTAGCTAMRPEEMLALQHWLNRKARPLLVQLPEEQYRRLKDEWSLP